MKYLIVNADDFGLTDGVNRGIIRCFETGILTSASLMVRQAGAEAAAHYAKAQPRLSVGLHLDLGEWVFSHDEWVQLYSIVPTNDPEAIAQEIESQLATFLHFVGRPPTHIDSHQHVHRDEPIRSMALAMGRRFGVPVREFSHIPYCGSFYGQDAEGQSFPEILSIQNLKHILGTLPEGTVELGCHPGYRDGLVSAYAAERELEVRTLCAPEIRSALPALGIQLVSFQNAPFSHSAMA